MKAKDLLHFALNFQNDLMKNGCGFLDVSDFSEFESQEDFLESFFGIKPTKKIPEGEYLYVFADCISDLFFVENKKFFAAADLYLKEDNNDYGIYLFKVED